MLKTMSDRTSPCKGCASTTPLEVKDDKEAGTLIEGLMGNDCLKMVSINCYQSPSVTVTGFAEMLAFNSTLELIDLRNMSVPDQEAVVGLEGERHISAAPAKAEQNSRRHKCTFCGKQFAKRHLLKQHMLIHTGKNPFQCHLCLMAFKQKGNLTVHLRTHLGERPFQCHIYKANFCHSNTLTCHLRTYTDKETGELEMRGSTGKRKELVWLLLHLLQQSQSRVLFPS
ncbi:hypothetical protein HPB50_028106 [Hyalomma asiaticum]|nr:hypothetical protein HPB50_028106 [Hyalomma asiaticum]